MRLSLLFVLLILTATSSWAGQKTLATFEDPAGDDSGTGTLVYPQRADFRAGDLDLLELKVKGDDEGIWFEATFKNPIRNPASIPGTVGADSLANFARKGFYQFNIDIYIDTDRISGSGNTDTMPGRQVKIDPAYAWEKAVILTPRPELTRQQLIDTLAEQYPDRTTADIQASIDKSTYFPTRIKVQGKSISFFVPASFFSGNNGSEWALTAFVTGASTINSADFTLSSNRTNNSLEKLTLGVMQPELGHPRETLGYSGAKPSPVVDLLSDSVELQIRQLTAQTNLTGVTLGIATKKIVAPVASPSSVPVADTKTNSTTVIPLGKLLTPGNATATKPPSSTPVQTGPASESSIARRLQTLQQLLDQKLINEDEYKQQKQRILQEI